jgi:hypothetical protein
MFKKLICSSLVIAALAAPALAQDIFTEDFESYATDDAMKAAWVPNGSVAQAFLFDFNTSGQPYTDLTPPAPGSVEGKAVLFDGTSGGFLKRAAAFTAVPTATKNVEVSVDLAHDMLTSNKRLSLGLRYTDASVTPAVTENLLELGFWNGLTVGPNGEFFQFGFRTALMPGNTNWQAYSLPTNKDQLFEIADSAFHTFKALISTTDVTFTLDLFGDGLNNGTGEPGVDATNVIAAVTSANGYNDIRFGGPSGVTSPDPFLGVDNIALRLVDKVIVEPDGDADFDNDGDVDGRDFLIWQRGFGLPDALNQDGDADDDDDVDGDDLVIWQTKYGETPALVSSVAVPEPAVGMMVLTALGSLLAVKWR